MLVFQWQIYLPLGEEIMKNNAIRLANVKPAVFHRWVSGKAAAPSCKLNCIKHHAFATLRIKHRKKLNQCLDVGLDEEIIKAQFLWKNMIFDQLSMVAKRRFFSGLKKVYR